jgi:apolipoprotein N-acyltransferase
VTSSAPDPYDVPPPWWRRHSGLVWAVSVGVLTAVLTVLSFPPYNAPQCAYAFAVPALLWAYRRPAFRRFAWTLFAAQAAAWTAILWWLHPVTWAGLFLVGPVVGAWVGVWYLAAWWTMPRMNGRPAATRLLGLAALAAGWVIVEWTRTWLLGGFPWLPLAASQWQRTSVLQIAAFTGAGGVSFVLVAVNIGFAAVAHSLFHDRQTGWRLRRPEFLFALFLLMVCVSVQVQETFNRARFSLPVARVAFVQPAIPQDVKWNPAKGGAIFETLEKGTLLAAMNEPDLILWPEACTPWAVRGDDRVREWVESLVARAKAPLVLGSIAIENPGKSDEAWYNGMFVVAPDLGLQTAYYSKRHLVPFGEYVPLRPVFGWLNKFVPVGDDFGRGRTAVPLLVPVNKESLAVGPLICFEDIFPALACADARDGADVLFVATNDAWYGEGGAAYQHAAHSVLRAVETRRPVLRCGNNGWSGWIDEFGAIRNVLMRDADGMIHTKPGIAGGTVYFGGQATISVSRDARWIGRRSFYVEHGDWFVAVCAALAALGWLTLRTGAGITDESAGPGASK